MRGAARRDIRDCTTRDARGDAENSMSNTEQRSHFEHTKPSMIESKPMRADHDEGLPVVVLTGFMGVGKTEVGRELASILGLEFLDTDGCIEAREGKSVSEIFEAEGEDYFRAAENRLCRELAGRTGLVIATGGGTLMNEDNFRCLSALGKLVLLTASGDEILRRTKGDEGRPLLKRDPAAEGEISAGRRRRIEELMRLREQVYGRIESRIDTTGLRPRRAARRIAASISMPSRASAVNFDGGAAPGRRVGGETRTSIAIGRGLLSNAGELLRSAGLDSRVFVMIPRRVREHFLEQLSESLDAASIRWDEIPVEDGETGKTLAQVQELLGALAASKADRDSVILAAGGGVTGDIAGFAAAVYMRGLRLVHAPTTLLAQVDSSIGGKTGVNLPSAKNVVGSFHQPRLVISDPCALRTLPDSEISNGMAEVIKTAIVGSPGLFEYLESALCNGSTPGAELGLERLRDTKLLERCVAECAEVKSRIVEEDPFDTGRRRILNLGHTLGHAFEADAGYSGPTHGQAVSVGLAASLRISERRGVIDPGLASRARHLLERCGLPVSAPRADGRSILKRLSLDKKRSSGRMRFVLATGLGSTSIVDDVTDAELIESINGDGK